MKEKIYSGLVNVVILFIVLLMGFGAFSIYNTVMFQKAYQANILSAQRGQIAATCEAIAEREAEAEKAEVEEQ